jgi:hypothetical protein
LRALGAGAAILLAVLAGKVLADTWLPPTVKEYYSAERDVRFTVVPRGLSSPLAYFEDLVDGRENAGQAENGETIARGVLEERTGADSWDKVWAGPLVNDVSPVSAMVAPSGRYVVTFDNWHSIGRGQHVVVIYDRQGRLIRSLELGDIIPPEWIRGLSHSVSSTAWAGEHRFSGEHLLLQVMIPSKSTVDEGGQFAEFALELGTGFVSPVDAGAWSDAMTLVEERNQALDREEAEAKRRWIEPLQAPEASTLTAWHEYLREAFFRSAPDWENSYPSTKVLNDQHASNYLASEGWIRDALSEAYPSRNIMIAAVSEPELVAFLLRTGHEIPAKSLAGVNVYVAVSGEAWPAVRSALAATGATLIHLDIAVPIPQRPERLDWLDNEAGGMTPPALY